MSKKIVLKYPGAYQSFGNLVYSTHDVPLEDSVSIKTMTVERINCPKGFMFNGDCVFRYTDSMGYNIDVNIRTNAGVNARRFGDIYHAWWCLNQILFTISSGSTTDVVEARLDESRSFMQLRSLYSGPITPRLSISINLGTPEEPGFAYFVAATFKLPLSPDYMSFPSSGTWYSLSWYDQNGGVGEIYMSFEIPTTFTKKYSTSFDDIALNSMVASFPAPTIEYPAPLLEYSNYTNFPLSTIEKYYTLGDAKVYERQTYNVKDMIAPMSILFSSELYTDSIKVYFYADLGRVLSEVFFPAPTYIIVHINSIDGLEKEEIVPRLLL